jgi:hypothetical protein
MNENACKIEGVTISETSKFRCTVAEDAKVRTCIFREFLTLILWPFSKHYKFIALIQRKHTIRGHKIKVSLHMHYQL